MNELSTKYAGWVIVYAGSRVWIGLVVLGKAEVGENVTLRPCFEADHQIALRNQPGAPPAAGLVPFIKPPDLCLTADVAMHTRIDSLVHIDGLSEEQIDMYDEVIMSVFHQFEAKQTALRAVRSKIQPPPPGFDPSKFKGG